MSHESPYPGLTKSGSVINKVIPGHQGKVLMTYRSQKTSGQAVFPDLETAMNAADLAVIYEYGGFHEVVLISGEDYEVTHKSAIEWLHD